MFGTAVATMGMLMSCAYILAMDTFGPITDNAGGIAEMSHQAARDPQHHRRPRRRGQHNQGADQGLRGRLGGAGGLPALLGLPGQGSPGASPIRPLINGQVPINLRRWRCSSARSSAPCWSTSSRSLAIRAVGRAARADDRGGAPPVPRRPRHHAGTSRPDYASCVDIAARAALREMIAPGLLAVGYSGAGGSDTAAGKPKAALLMVGTIAGILLANVLNNGGGAWDNAKKFIEAGGLQGRRTAQCSARAPRPTRPSVVGDTVGDPFKDTAGPSLHVLIKLLSTITLVLAPLFIR